ncbi:uracil-DNA glycosylase [Aquabacterium sp.]|uniref:uracil-DNA glycosylase n=1 Tax=Aquabacterium sp. TaxID=1872578 RepID=UPI002488320A|nr:uracil-DNA glycosylase [Aquabacterium sp.]MDI1260049.1 uracil-DNA glycosylase [Aquabacterium sp.]
MSWSERQRAMLREMGIPAFWPVPPDAPSEDAPVGVSATDVAQATRPTMPTADASALAPLHASRPVEAPTAPAPAARSARPEAKPPVSIAAAATAGIEAILRAPPEGIDQMDWSTLRQAVSGCTACGLCESRQQTVFGVGHEQASVMIIGEAPGEQEDRQGEPFVGRAGQLLDRMLSPIGLTRGEAQASSQVFIANVLKCRPPGNRNPLPAEVAQCEPYLMRQIALVKPRVIIAMGRFAAQSLLKTSEPIGRLRGRLHEVQGTPVVVTYHPAYLLRNPVDKGLVWDDLCRVRELLLRPV